MFLMECTRSDIAYAINCLSSSVGNGAGLVRGGTGLGRGRVQWGEFGAGLGQDPYPAPDPAGATKTCPGPAPDPENNVPDPPHAGRARGEFSGSGLKLPTLLSRYMSNAGVDLIGYVDSNYANDRDSRRFTTCGSCITWKSQLQQSVALSTTKSEYIAATEASKEALWLEGTHGKMVTMTAFDPNP
ncbi:UNVERIFIED_CONTAM: hypothetical protein Scaly_0603600 [Sesamum calycinum]|uniref:Uncharacterized protein n=1 Tax=Sesamum calycinum TaxID=2727403 RepID=A0AAW2RUN5_9LAMI